MTQRGAALCVGMEIITIPQPFFKLPRNQNMAAGFVVLGVSEFHPQFTGSIMSQSKYCVALALVACLALSATASAKKITSTKAPSPRRAEAASKDAVTLEISGPSDAQAAAAYQKALASSGLSAKIHESKKGGKPLKVMAAVDKTTDLGPIGKAVMTAVPTKPGQMPPALELMIYAPLTKETRNRRWPSWRR